MSDEITLTSEITVRLIEKAGSDAMIVAAAKVSTSPEEALQFAARERDGECRGRIRHMMKHRHGTPFEKGYLCTYVHAPQFVWWQWTRHRVGHSFNIESSRYHEMRPVFYVPPPDRAMMIPARGYTPARPHFDAAEPDEYESTKADLAAAYAEAWQSYTGMTARGVGPEIARAALGTGVYFSGWVTQNPRSVMHFLSLRTFDAASAVPSYVQHETAVAARAIEAIFAEHWPLTHQAFCDNGRVAP